MQPVKEPTSSCHSRATNFKQHETARQQQRATQDTYTAPHCSTASQAPVSTLLSLLPSFDLLRQHHQTLLSVQPLAAISALGHCLINLPIPLTFSHPLASPQTKTGSSAAPGVETRATRQHLAL